MCNVLSVCCIECSTLILTVQEINLRAENETSILQHRQQIGTQINEFETLQSIKCMILSYSIHF